MSCVIDYHRIEPIVPRHPQHFTALTCFSFNSTTPTIPPTTSETCSCFRRCNTFGKQTSTWLEQTHFQNQIAKKKLLVVLCVSICAVAKQQVSCHVSRATLYKSGPVLLFELSQDESLLHSSVFFSSSFVRRPRRLIQKYLHSSNVPRRGCPYERLPYTLISLPVRKVLPPGKKHRHRNLIAHCRGSHKRRHRHT